MFAFSEECFLEKHSFYTTLHSVELRAILAYILAVPDLVTLPSPTSWPWTLTFDNRPLLY